jgi:hypothetical protein
VRLDEGIAIEDLAFDDQSTWQKNDVDSNDTTLAFTYAGGPRDPDQQKDPDRPRRELELLMRSFMYQPQQKAADGGEQAGNMIDADATLTLTINDIKFAECDDNAQLPAVPPISKVIELRLSKSVAGDAVVASYER